ncbi:MAG: arginase family protein, partial [Brumimicrobium sp.]
MKDISIYFQAIQQDITFEEEMLGTKIAIHSPESFPEFNKKGIALIYVPENRRSNHQSIDNNDAFRKSFYHLYSGANWSHTIYDLGTIQPGDKIEDTIHAISTVCQELIKKNIIPLVIGGSQDLTIALYKAYEKLEQLINLTAIDHKLDIGTIEEAPKSDGWLSHILLHKPCYLFNYSNLGAQSHY